VCSPTNVSGIQTFLRNKSATRPAMVASWSRYGIKFKETVFENIESFVTHKILRANSDPSYYNKEVKYYIFCWPCIMEWFLVNDQLDAQIPFYVFIFIFNSLHVSSTSCSSSGETNCINTNSGNFHSENRWVI